MLSGSERNNNSKFESIFSCRDAESEQDAVPDLVPQLAGKCVAPSGQAVHAGHVSCSECVHTARGLLQAVGWQAGKL